RRGVVLQCGTAADVPVRRLRTGPADGLDGPGHVPGVRLRGPHCRHHIWGTAIGAHDSFLFDHPSVRLFARPCSDGLVGRISQPDAGHDYGSHRIPSGSRMSFLSRRKLITGGLATAAGASGLAVAARLASRYGLIPPDHGGIYAPGETLTYAAQRI